MLANLYPTLTVVMVVVVVVVVIMVVIVIVVRVIGHAMVAVPALAAGAVAMLVFDKASHHQARQSDSDQQFHRTTFARA